MNKSKMSSSVGLSTEYLLGYHSQDKLDELSAALTVIQGLLSNLSSTLQPLAIRALVNRGNICIVSGGSITCEKPLNVPFEPSNFQIASYFPVLISTALDPDYPMNSVDVNDKPFSDIEPLKLHESTSLESKPSLSEYSDPQAAGLHSQANALRAMTTQDYLQWLKKYAPVTSKEGEYKVVAAQISDSPIPEVGLDDNQQRFDAELETQLIPFKRFNYNLNSDIECLHQAISGVTALLDQAGGNTAYKAIIISHFSKYLEYINSLIKMQSFPEVVKLNFIKACRLNGIDLSNEADFYPAGFREVFDSIGRGSQADIDATAQDYIKEKNEPSIFKRGLSSISSFFGSWFGLSKEKKSA